MRFSARRNLERFMRHLPPIVSLDTTRSILFTMLTCAAALAQAAEPPSARLLTADEARTEIDLVRRSVDTVHPGAERYQTREELEEWYVHLEAIADAGVDELTWYRELSRFAASLRCGHSRVESPPRIARYRAEHPTHLPFHFVLFDGRLYVDVVAPGCDALARRDEIVAIDGRAVPAIVDELGEAMVIDGFTDHIRPRRLQEPYEFADSGFDHYYPVYYGLKDRFSLEVLGADDDGPRSVTVEAITRDQWTALLQPGARNFDEGVEARRLDEHTALLRVDTFVNYRRPIDPLTILVPIFEGFQRDDVEHLIFDLRQCGGGSVDVYFALARLLLDEPFVMGRPSRLKAIRIGDLEEHLTTWVEDAFQMPEEMFRDLGDGWYEFGPELAGAGAQTVEPHPAHFRGDITVLIGPRNASGATMLIAKLADEGRVRLIGQPTGGSAEGPTAGVITFLRLPHSGVIMNIPVLQERVAIDDFEPGMGVYPDVFVAPTVDDHFAGGDPVLERARVW